jgi:hypothetical protein
MKRSRFTILSGVSLLHCLVTVVLWVRSYFVSDYYQDETTFGYRTNLASEDGSIAMWSIGIGSRAIERDWWEHHPEGIGLQDVLAGNGGVRFNRPYWQIFLFTAVIGFWPWLARIRLLSHPLGIEWADR